jgi:hypothetical protein
MKSFLFITAAALAFAATDAQGQAPTPAPAAPQSSSAPQQSAAPAADAAIRRNDLDDLAKTTFGCPRAGLNAAAREAASVRSQGTYQFSYFNIVSDSHQATYEVHFKSNYAGEPELKYCVLVYCQQGWDPKTAKTTVTLMTEPRRGAAGAHAAMCGVLPAPAKPPVRKPPVKK